MSSWAAEPKPGGDGLGDSGERDPKVLAQPASTGRGELENPDVGNSARPILAQEEVEDLGAQRAREVGSAFGPVHTTSS